jgi:hypothetical protein
MKNISVIGAGQMGNGIAHVCALAGYDVLLHDVKKEKVDAAFEIISGNLSRQVARGKITDAETDKAMKRIQPAISLDDFAQVDFAIEAATEDEKVKRQILEYLAVRKLAPEGKRANLCLVGPPGVGKTSLGQSIARAMGRDDGRPARHVHPEQRDQAMRCGLLGIVADPADMMGVDQIEDGHALRFRHAGGPLHGRSRCRLTKRHLSVDDEKRRRIHTVDRRIRGIQQAVAEGTDIKRHHADAVAVMAREIGERAMARHLRRIRFRPAGRLEDRSREAGQVIGREVAHAEVYRNVSAAPA